MSSSVSGSDRLELCGRQGDDFTLERLEGSPALAWPLSADPLGHGRRMPEMFRVAALGDGFLGIMGMPGIHESLRETFDGLARLGSTSSFHSTWGWLANRLPAKAQALSSSASLLKIGACHLIPRRCRSSAGGRTRG